MALFGVVWRCLGLVHFLDLAVVAKDPQLAWIAFALLTALDALHQILIHPLLNPTPNTSTETSQLTPAQPSGSASILPT